MGGSRSRFELSIAVPADRRFAPLIREVVVHGARQSGSTEEAAMAFGGNVEDAAGEMLGAATVNDSMSILIRKHEGMIEVVIDGGGATRTLALPV